jgi:hypothetical protein
MNDAARPWIGLFFKCLAVLAGIFAFIFFMRMDEESSFYQKLRDSGVVSRALVTDKQVDSARIEGRRGRSRTVEYNFIHIRHVPKSTVKFSDFPAKVKEADLPKAPPVTGDPLKDGGYSGIMDVPQATYDAIKVGDMLTVVNTPWDSDSPVQVSDIGTFDPSVYYPRMGLSLALMVLFWLIGRRISKGGTARAAVQQ